LRPVADDRDSRIGRDALLESVDIVHDKDQVHAVPTSYEVTEVATVLVAHPAVGTDEPEPTARLEATQAHLVEADVDVRAASHGRAVRAVGTHAPVRYILQSNVWRIPDYEVGAPGGIFPEQVVPLPNPAVYDFGNLGWLPTIGEQALCYEFAAPFDVPID
jgi:hypothetical protein